MANKDKFKVGDRVSFLRSHDKTLRLQGTISGVHTDDDDVVNIETIPDGRAVEVVTIESVNAADVTLIEKADVAGEVIPPVPVVLTEHQEKFLVSRGYTGTSEDHHRFVNSMSALDREGFFLEAGEWVEPVPVVTDPVQQSGS